MLINDAILIFQKLTTLILDSPGITFLNISHPVHFPPNILHPVNFFPSKSCIPKTPNSGTGRSGHQPFFVLICGFMFLAPGMVYRARETKIEPNRLQDKAMDKFISCHRFIQGSQNITEL